MSEMAQTNNVFYGFAPGLMDRLPPVRGRLTENASLGDNSWFRVGGPAEVLFKPADKDDLIKFLTVCPDDVPLTVIGVTSNLLIRDGGIPGVVIRLGRSFADIEVEGQTRIHAGAAALDMSVAMAACKAGIGGLEFLSGVPGTIGGALRMNAGAYGSETKDVLVSADAVDRYGKSYTLSPSEMKMSYRHNDVPDDYIFTGAVFEGQPEQIETIQSRIDTIKEARSNSQPIKSRTGGSTFANPAVEELAMAGLDPATKTWQLVDMAGCRGLIVGGAQMSEMHCNFMINTGDATAADIELLGETVRRRVLDKFGINLRWEIRRIGVPLNNLDEGTMTMGAA